MHSHGAQAHRYERDEKNGHSNVLRILFNTVHEAHITNASPAVQVIVRREGARAPIVQLFNFLVASI